jgi:hypothetical protein
MMAMEEIGSLVLNIENRLHQQTANRQTGANLQAAENADSMAIIEDTFSPSSQNTTAQLTAQAAGMFQLSQGRLSPMETDLQAQQATANARNMDHPH